MFDSCAGVSSGTQCEKKTNNLIILLFRYFLVMLLLYQGYHPIHSPQSDIFSRVNNQHLIDLVKRRFFFLLLELVCPS